MKRKKKCLHVWTRAIQLNPYKRYTVCIRCKAKKPRTIGSGPGLVGGS
jgi:hypothetical protein